MSSTVLVVEDNELSREALVRRLARSGYAVLEAEDGAQAVQVASRQCPDIILMDLDLPVMDGWQALKELRQKDHTCEIPVIALTAHAMVGDKERVMAAGFDEYDTKPIEFGVLKEKIERMLTLCADPASSQPRSSRLIP